MRADPRSMAELVELVAGLARVARPNVVLCLVAGTALPRELAKLDLPCRILVGTVDDTTEKALAEAGMDTIHLPSQAANKHGQVQQGLAYALQAKKVTGGDFVLCVVDDDLFPEEGDLIVLTDVRDELTQLSPSELLELSDGVRPEVLEATLLVACMISQAIRRAGQRIGAIFMLGDADPVLAESEQLIPNPFHGHDSARRQITNPELHPALVELAKLDGAFVVRGDGTIESAAVFLVASDAKVKLPTGLGTRHRAAASTTARTKAIAIVVSATDGNVRVFDDGELVLKMDPELSPLGPLPAAR